jgi:hypothetical protein
MHWQDHPQACQRAGYDGGGLERWVLGSDSSWLNRKPIINISLLGVFSCAEVFTAVGPTFYDGVFQDRYLSEKVSYEVDAGNKKTGTDINHFLSASIDRFEQFGRRFCFT